MNTQSIKDLLCEIRNDVDDIESWTQNINNKLRDIKISEGMIYKMLKED